MCALQDQPRAQCLSGDEGWQAHQAALTHAGTDTRWLAGWLAGGWLGIQVVREAERQACRQAERQAGELLLLKQ
ncbi:hypothetical protein E2C01_071035 [Portunus trituberculatus]|uniref:Uncharacterized protein n=1 Tax=Portunus trituberculatus TaxID=210409 RepID=A0A5B7I6Y2_PORTR|nr:hypothetical protein [Portunus trituberculatus]